MRLVDRQREFSMAVIDPDADIPSGLFSPRRLPSQKRFAVYRNNVIVGLVDALQAGFPATCRIIGEEFFRAMAREYVRLEPPTSPILFHYGDRLPDFISRFEPAATVPYLADIARIERACSEAYHASERQALGPDALAGVPSYKISDLRLLLHPSLRIVRSQFPSVRIWRMNVGDGLPSPVDLESGGEDALVVRPEGNVDVHLLSPGVAGFVSSLAHGNTLMMATEAALSESSSFDLSSDLAGLIKAGAFVGYRFTADTAA